MPTAVMGLVMDRIWKMLSPRIGVLISRSWVTDRFQADYHAVPRYQSDGTGDGATVNELLHPRGNPR
jgi:hypothetical protein